MTEAPPVLLDVTRSGFVESHHRGSFVLLNADGSVHLRAGYPDAPAFPRSSLKPLQAVAMVEAGFAGRDASLALAAASHDGEDVHVAGARATLRAAGLSEPALQCPPALPANEHALRAHLRSGGGPEAIRHNCSGKHAAMVATCVSAGWPVATYRDPGHRLQRAARAQIESLAGEPVVATGVDGCGAPAFAISLTGLARAFGGVATSPASSAAGLVRDAMRAHPRLIGGTGRAVTELTAEVDGLLCKDGAEAVWAAALPDGRAFAAKIEDGGARALPPVLAAVLTYWGCAGSAVQRWSTVPVLGGGAPVGELGWSPQLRALLAI
jgi:L-asparaginase II